MSYIPLSSQMRLNIPVKVRSMSIVKRGLFSTYADSDNSQLFSLDQQGLVPAEKQDSIWFSLTLERDLQMISYAHQTYTILDLLAEVGGFVFLIFIVLSFAVSMLTYEDLDNYLAAKLYKVEKPPLQKTVLNQYDPIKPGSWQMFQNCFRCLLPKRLMQRYPVTRNEKALQRAKAKLAKEMNAVELLRKIRYISSAAHCFLPDYQRRKLKEISKCRAIDPDQVIKQRNQRKLGNNSL